jgi:hypothetical protein
VRAMVRPLQSAAAEYLVVAVRYSRCNGNIIANAEWTSQLGAVSTRNAHSVGEHTI